MKIEKVTGDDYLRCRHRCAAAVDADFTHPGAVRFSASFEATLLYEDNGATVVGRVQRATVS
jgi:hypothetical protein